MPIKASHRASGRGPRSMHVLTDREAHIRRVNLGAMGYRSGSQWIASGAHHPDWATPQSEPVWGVSGENRIGCPGPPWALIRTSV